MRRWAPVGPKRDFLDPLLGACQQIGAMRLQRLAARIDFDRIFKPDGALFKLIDDLFEFCERSLEGEAGDIFILLRLNGHTCQFPCQPTFASSNSLP